MKLRISWQVYPIPELPHRWELRHNYVVDKAILPLFLFPSFSRQSRDTPSSRRRGPCYHLLSPVHRLRAVVALCDNNEHTIVSSSCTRNPSRVDKSYIACHWREIETPSIESLFFAEAVRICVFLGSSREIP